MTGHRLSATKIALNPLVLGLIGSCFLLGCEQVEIASQQDDNSDSNTTSISTNLAQNETSSDIEALGQRLYFDRNLSNPAGQSCADCHLPETGFDDPDSNLPVSEGVVAGRFGSRNSPTASYSAFIPPFQFNRQRNAFEGGLFWDGRADDLQAQAQAPFLNAVEMNNTEENVVAAVASSDYADAFRAVYGSDAFDDTETAYAFIADAIAAFEQGQSFNSFSSKFDAVQTGTAQFTASEQRGLNLFNGRADCRRCHNSNGNQPLFSDFSFHNLGTPANPNNPFYGNAVEFNPDGAGFVDLGLGAVVNDARENGKFRVPTLRNIALTAPYMHNGVFNTLEQVVAFYNSRDTDPSTPAPEVNANLDNRIGALGLSARDQADLVAFLNTLSDGYSE